MTQSIEDLKGRNIVIFDLEIKTPIEKCSRGWDSHDEMGISVGCLYDYETGRYRVFMDDNLPELIERLNRTGTLIVAFNHIGFDNKLLRCHGPLKPDSELLNYDMMLVSKAGCGLGPTDYVKGFRLDDHLKACGLPLKTAEGAKAPEWWQQGKLGILVDYCLNDVTQERALFEYMYGHGEVASAYNPEAYKIKIPVLDFL